MNPPRYSTPTFPSQAGSSTGNMFRSVEPMLQLLERSPEGREFTQKFRANLERMEKELRGQLLKSGMIA